MQVREIEVKNNLLLQELAETTKQLKLSYEEKLKILRSQEQNPLKFPTQLIIFSTSFLLLSFFWYSLYTYMT